MNRLLSALQTFRAALTELVVAGEFDTWMRFDAQTEAFGFGGTNAVNVTLDNVSVSGNKQIGLLAQGANAQIRTSDSTITGNATGMQGSGGGAIVSFGDNRNYGNVVNGAPNSSVPKQ